MRLARLHHKNHIEPVWHVALAVLVAVGLQLILNDSLSFGSKYAIAGLEVLLFLILTAFRFADLLRRLIATGLIALISLVNIVSLGIVINVLFTGTHINGRQLLISGVAIYLTNIIVFGLWYWEMDDTKKDVPDFLFPQASEKGSDWTPTFFDYLYISITNATAFSPTDTMPLTHRAKLLMSLQAVTSLVTVALVAARAVNILS